MYSIQTIPSPLQSANPKLLPIHGVQLLLLLFTPQGAFAQLPFELPPIEYSKTEASDAVSILNEGLKSGTKTLRFDRKFGYLPALLSELDIPVSSQTLVFAKNSLQRHKISPKNPRAIYFNDDVYLGYVPGGDLIEIAATDKLLGSIFYTIEQKYEVSYTVNFARKNQQCLFCHASSHTGRVPGPMIQSVYTDSTGHRVFPENTIFPDPNGPLSTRFAGWFVTGTHGQQPHLGNLMLDSSSIPANSTTKKNGNVTDLSTWFDQQKYLSPHSDLIALLVLQHQTTVHNRLTAANHQVRRLIYQAKQSKLAPSDHLDAETSVAIDLVANELVDVLLMVDSLTFSEPVMGTSSFAIEFSRQGPSDSQGRSLRSLDLQTSLFEFPCSFLIYSEAFAALPRPLIQGVAKRMHQLLDGDVRQEKYAHLSPLKCKAIRSILHETKPGFLPSP